MKFPKDWILYFYVLVSVCAEEDSSYISGESQESVRNQRAILPGSHGSENHESKVVGGGRPGHDFPVFNSVPRTNFDCTGRVAGYYADEAAACQVFHICHTDTRKDSFLCPNGTIFHQLRLVCDWWYNVDCDSSALHESVNNKIGQVPSKKFSGKDEIFVSSKTSSLSGSPKQVDRSKIQSVNLPGGTGLTGQTFTLGSPQAKAFPLFQTIKSVKSHSPPVTTHSVSDGGSRATSGVQTPNDVSRTISNINNLSGVSRTTSSIHTPTGVSRTTGSHTPSILRTTSDIHTSARSQHKTGVPLQQISAPSQSFNNQPFVSTHQTGVTLPKVSVPIETLSGQSHKTTSFGSKTSPSTFAVTSPTPRASQDTSSRQREETFITDDLQSTAILNAFNIPIGKHAAPIRPSVKLDTTTAGVPLQKTVPGKFTPKPSVAHFSDTTQAPQRASVKNTFRGTPRFSTTFKNDARRPGFFKPSQKLATQKSTTSPPPITTRRPPLSSLSLPPQTFQTPAAFGISLPKPTLPPRTRQSTLSKTQPVKQLAGGVSLTPTPGRTSITPGRDAQSVGRPLPQTKNTFSTVKHRLGSPAVTTGKKSRVVNIRPIGDGEFGVRVKPISKSKLVTHSRENQGIKLPIPSKEPAGKTQPSRGTQRPSTFSHFQGRQPGSLGVPLTQPPQQQAVSRQGNTAGIPLQRLSPKTSVTQAPRITGVTLPSAVFKTPSDQLSQAFGVSLPSLGISPQQRSRGTLHQSLKPSGRQRSRGKPAFLKKTPFKTFDDDRFDDFDDYDGPFDDDRFDPDDRFDDDAFELDDRFDDDRFELDHFDDDKFDFDDRFEDDRFDLDDRLDFDDRFDDDRFDLDDRFDDDRFDHNDHDDFDDRFELDGRFANNFNFDNQFDSGNRRTRANDKITQPILPPSEVQLPPPPI